MFIAILFSVHVTNDCVSLLLMQGIMCREKKALQFGPPNWLKEMEFMFEKSHVSAFSACIPGQDGTEDSQSNEVNEADDLMEQIPGDQCTPTSSTRNHRKRKRKSVSPNKKGKNPMVRMMSLMVDDVIRTNSVTSKALTGDFTRESVKEAMAMVKECGAVEGSGEHYIATQLFKNSANREIFLTFETNKGRFNWLRRCYEERNK